MQYQNLICLKDVLNNTCLIVRICSIYDFRYSIHKFEVFFFRDICMLKC